MERTRDWPSVDERRCPGLRRTQVPVETLCSIPSWLMLRGVGCVYIVLFSSWRWLRICSLLRLPCSTNSKQIKLLKMIERRSKSIFIRFYKYSWIFIKFARCSYISIHFRAWDLTTKGRTCCPCTARFQAGLLSSRDFHRFLSRFD